MKYYKLKDDDNKIWLYKEENDILYVYDEDDDKWHKIGEKERESRCGE